MGDEEVREQAGVTCDRVRHIPFGNVEALEQVCRQHRPAAFIVEPIQGEGGVNCPADDYLATAAAICRRHGAVFIIDEIQTGLGRLGRLFATDFDRIRPDILLVGKALSGGIVPVSAAMMTADAWKRALRS